MNKAVLVLLVSLVIIIVVVIIVLVMRSKNQQASSTSTSTPVSTPVTPVILPGCSKSTVVPSYQFCQGQDSAGNDIGQSANLADNITGLASACDNNSLCRGFNTNGWLKNSIMDQSKWTKWSSDPAKGLYVKGAERFTPRIQATSTGFANLNPFA